jgi:hypothetical protein
MGALLVGAASGLAAAAGLAVAARPLSGWTVLGWGLATMAAVVSGAWAASSLGTAGAGFLAAVVGGIAVRAAVLVGGLVGALRSGSGEGGWFVAGFAAGLVPQWVFEIAWFHRRGRGLAAGAGAGER